MNAAAATSAAESTLRAGRKDAPRNPRRETVQSPRPLMICASRARSQRASAKRNAASSAALAPKKAPACALRLTNPSAISARPAIAKNALSRALRRARFGSAPGCSSEWAPRSDRGLCRDTERSDSTTQISDAATPPANPISRLPGVMCVSSSVVPTAPTHHVLRP